MNEIPVPLKRPVQAHGKEIGSITIRRPKGGDITACGFPMLMAGDGSGTDAQGQPDARAISKYIARLGDVPASTVAALDAEDWQACMVVVMGFFGGSETPKST
jgi:Phage tail assembly chaperone proteins, E, or 41 or 14